MKMMIFLIFAFLIIVYVYTFVKIRKRRRANTKSAVLEFNQKYHGKKKTDIQNTQLDLNYKKYITKYNSSIDYINKDDLLT
ncbi:MAG: hypothetical protein J6J79_06025 [Lachnospiraceae bacterium]|nr:hypothetical protein [Lachnospiraceae bacterium]